jgi:DNA-binding transcriptional LysR family regulator
MSDDSGLSETGAGQRWLGVEFRHLGALAAVAREGSFRGAAASLGYVQSAISGQIAQLERAVGAKLIERSSGSAGAKLTDAGRSLLGHVDEILARFEAARIDVQALATGTGESVRIATLDGIAERRLPAILADFRERFPSGQVVIDESYADEQNFDRLARGEIDLMISELPLPPGPFDHTVLERDVYVLLVASGTPLAEQSAEPRAEQLSRLPLILPAPTRPRDFVASRLRETLVDQPPWLRPRGAAVAQALVAAGLGAAVVPRVAVDLDDPSTVAIRAPSLLPHRFVVLVKHRERQYSATVLGMIEVIETYFGVVREPPRGPETPPGSSDFGPFSHRSDRIADRRGPPADGD